MSLHSPIALVTRLARPTAGAFRGAAAVASGITRKQLATLRQQGAIQRVLPDTYRLTAAPRSHEQALHAALLWAGERAVADGRSAGAIYGLEGVRAVVAEISVPPGWRRSNRVVVRYRDDRRALMVRKVRGSR